MVPGYGHLSFRWGDSLLSYPQCPSGTPSWAVLCFVTGLRSVLPLDCPFPVQRGSTGSVCAAGDAPSVPEELSGLPPAAPCTGLALCDIHLYACRVSMSSHRTCRRVSALIPWGGVITYYILKHILYIHLHMHSFKLIFFLFTVLGIRLRVFGILGKCPKTEP